MTTRRWMINNVTVLTMDQVKTVYKNGLVLIEGEDIIFVGDQASYEKSGFASQKNQLEKVIDGNKGILMPGMINAHTHVAMVVFRSLADDVPNRLKDYIFPLEKSIVDEELVYIGAQYGIAEMLLGGVTTFCDMYYYENAVAKAVSDMGIRAILGETVVDFLSPDGDQPYSGLDYSRSFIEKWQDHPLITPTVAPHAPYTNSTEKLQEAHQLARDKKVPLIMHVAEMGYETQKYDELYGMTPVTYLNHIGVLDHPFIGAHFVNVTDSDLDILEKNQIGISHNVGANTKGAKGVAPAPKMYHRGLRIGLGTDGPMSGNTLDIFAQMALVGKVHKLNRMDRSVFPAEEIVEMATMGGARALYLEDKVGSISVGKKADLVLLETDSVNMQPNYNDYSTIVYAANPSNVSSVWVNGQLKVWEKKLVHVDLRDLQSQLLEVQNKVKHSIENR